MDLHAEISYPHTPVEDAFDLVVDKAFREAVCKATRAIEHEVRVDRHTDGGASAVIDRTLPADLPPFARRLLGDTVDIRQTEEWGAPAADGTRIADVVVSVKGQPAGMTGTAVLEPAGQGCREVVSGTVKVSIPFVGRKIEPEVARGIVAAMAKEQEVGLSWLA